MAASRPQRALVLRIGSERLQFVLQLGGRPLVLGRAPDVEVYVGGPLVSRRHCELRMGEKGLELHDMGSLNGTFLNGRKVETTTLLARGDRVRVGDTEIAVESDPVAPPSELSCERCGRLISMATLEDGQAFELGERILCSGCRTGGFAVPETERALTVALADEGFEVLGRISPRASWCPVYKARRKDLGDLVALKLLPVVDGLPEKKLERFKTEARVMAQLKHPNVVAVYDVRHRPRHSVIVMEFVPGETLQDRIERKKKIRTDEMLRYAIALAGALEAAGKLGVVHRNVKPSNVLVARGTGEPRLIDFGLAKILRPERGPGLTDATAPLGTIRYMAPEQLRDASAADPRSDLYSLAATMFHALTGKLPYHDRNELELLQAAEDGKPIAFDLSREEDIPQALKNVLACALMRDPGDRHPNATVLLDELRAALAKTPEPAAPLRDQDNTPRTQRLEAGLFTDDHLMTLVGKLGQMSRTGTLQVKSGVRGGSLVFEDGRVIAAQTLSGQRGEEAAYQLLGLFRGEWIFKPGPDHGIAPDAPLETKALVQEALRRRGLYETQSGD